MRDGRGCFHGTLSSAVDVWAPVIAALLGGSVAAIVTSWLGARSIAARDRKNDERLLRDKKAERLRAAFKPMLYIAYVWSDVVQQQTAPLSFEAPAVRDARLAASLERAHEGLSDAQLALDLEPGAGPTIGALFQETRSAYIACQTAQGLRDDPQVTMDERPTAGALAGLSEVLRDKVEALRVAMDAALTELGQAT